MITAAQADAVNDRIDGLLGPFGSWAVCPHGPDDGCACRKPAPSLIQQAAAGLGVDPADCVVIGDIGADAEAAYAAGARAIMVPTLQNPPSGDGGRAGRTKPACGSPRRAGWAVASELDLAARALTDLVLTGAWAGSAHPAGLSRASQRRAHTQHQPLILTFCKLTQVRRHCGTVSEPLCIPTSGRFFRRSFDCRACG